MEEMTNAEVETEIVNSNDHAACDVEQASQPFIGRWQRLISTTNWEKGKIIAQWRESLMEADAPVVEYSDDAWSQLVGGVTGQHVGRLRRVFQRFGETYDKYNGLFWSHFQAALDWDDAEMWLEGASQSKWSISDMRATRWQTMGDVQGAKPSDEEIVASEVDEDFAAESEEEPSPSMSGKVTEIQGGPLPEGPDFGEEDSHHSAQGSEDSFDDAHDEAATESRSELVRPFENLPELPADMADPFDSLKLAIIRHKADNWQTISLDAVLANLDALKQLAVAASEE